MFPSLNQADLAFIFFTDVKPSYTSISKPTTNKAMKLGSKSRDVESFVDQLKNEGEIVQSPAVTKSAVITGKLPMPSMENVEE